MDDMQPRTSSPAFTSLGYDGAMLTREPLLKGEPGSSSIRIAAGRDEISVRIKNRLPQILELAAGNIIGLPGRGANTDWKALSSDTPVSFGAPARELN